MTPELFLERGGELRIVREDFSVYVRYCYVHLFKFSFFSFFPCPLFFIFFSKQIAIPTNIFLQNLASIQKRTSPVKFAHLAEKSGKNLISNLSTTGRAGLLLRELRAVGAGHGLDTDGLEPPDCVPSGPSGGSNFYTISIL